MQTPHCGLKSFQNLQNQCKPTAPISPRERRCLESASDWKEEDVRTSNEKDERQQKAEEKKNEGMKGSQSRRAVTARHDEGASTIARVDERRRAKRHIVRARATFHPLRHWLRFPETEK